MIALSESVKMWSSMAASGVGVLIHVSVIMRKEEYVEILKRKVCLKRLMIFQQDPKHMLKLIQNWLETNKFEIMEWPDPNPMEKL